MLRLGLRSSPMPPITQWTDNDWIAIGTVVGAFGSVAVAVLAIWGEPIRAWIFRASLSITIDMREPDCIGIKLLRAQISQLPSGQHITKQAMTDSYYFRLLINNTRRSAARQVEVRLTAIRVKQGDGTFKDDPTFQPLDLKWANSGQVFVSKIDKNVPRHCDLCHVVHGSQPLSMDFDTEVEPFPIGGASPTKRAAGTYEVDLAAPADNAQAVRRTLEIYYAGTWHAKPSDMFTKGLTIKVRPLVKHA